VVSRRRRRQGIGKIIVSVESRVRKIEKNPSPKRLKANVVTTEKLGFRAVTTKTVAPDAITPNEAAFGTTVVSPTEPTEYLKEGTTWVNPDDGSTNVYSTADNTFVTVTDPVARLTADGKNTIYSQTSAPTGGTYAVDDLWFDTDDGNKVYRWSGTVWVSAQDTAIAAAAAAAQLAKDAADAAQSSADGKNKIYRQTTEPTGGTYAVGDTWFDTDGDNAIYRYASGSTGTVSKKALTGNVATLTTTAAHSFTRGESITVSGIDATFNGTYTVTAVPTSTTLTYAKTATNVVEIASSGTITSTAGWKAIVLGSNAITSISATQISTGTLAAGVIYGGSINANQISTGTIASNIVYAGTVNANQINAGTLAAGVIYAGTIAADKITSGTLASGVVYAGYIDADKINAGTISAAISMTSATLTSGIISTNTITSFSTVSTSSPRVTIAAYTLSFESSGVGIALDSGAGSAPGGISISANLSGTSSNLGIQGQSHGSGTGRGVIVLNSGSTGSAGYAAIGVSGGTNSNSILITNTYASLAVGSTAGTYALRNIKCVTSFTAASDTTGSDGDVVLVYTP
jgi:hypothetical protein